MKKITWTDDYIIGNEKIDEQHQNIVRLINQLVDEKDISLNSEIFHAVLNELVIYAYGHLTYEEGLLCDIDYPYFDDHKTLHEDYLEQFSDYSLESLWREDGTPERMLDYLIVWWNNHILVEDMKYKPFLQKTKTT
jgi:hemerythrin